MLIFHLLNLQLDLIQSNTSHSTNSQLQQTDCRVMLINAHQIAVHISTCLYQYRRLLQLPCIVGLLYAASCKPERPKHLKCDYEGVYDYFFCLIPVGIQCLSTMIDSLDNILYHKSSKPANTACTKMIYYKCGPLLHLVFIAH